MAKAGTVSGMRWIENSMGIAEYLKRDPQLYGALFASAYPAVEYAKGIAPVATGAYRDSIRVEWDEEGIGLRFFSDDNKAHWIEYGAAHTKRQRILGRAVDTIQVR